MTEFLLPLLAGTAAGILSGIGAGGGTLLLVYMTAVAGLAQPLAQGINLLYFIPAALLALPAHRKNGYIESHALFPAIIAGLVCAALSAWVATGLETAVLRKLFGGFLLLIGLREVKSRSH